MLAVTPFPDNATYVYRTVDRFAANCDAVPCVHVVTTVNSLYCNSHLRPTAFLGTDLGIA